MTAAAFVALPTVLILISWVTWRDVLPATLPTQWSGDLVVARQPTLAFAIVAGTVALGAAAFAVHATWSPTDYRRPRRAYLISGSVAGVAAAGWLISAGLAQASPGQAESGIGGFGLVALLSLGYGLLPFVIAPRGPRERSVDPGVDVLLEVPDGVSGG